MRALFMPRCRQACGPPCCEALGSAVDHWSSRRQNRKSRLRREMIAKLPTIAADSGGLVRYLEEIRKFPMLEPEEEFMLAKRWQEHEDSEAAHKLVTSHLRLVTRIAMGYRGYGLPIGEVISEGNVGLMQAVK